MEFSPKMRRILLAGTALALVATPSFALFGCGDIVFDPTNYAQRITQGTTAYTHYQAFMSNVRPFTVKSSWQTALSGLQRFDAASQFGETAGLGDALNTNRIESAIRALGQHQRPGPDRREAVYGRHAGRGQGAAMLALVEASDAVSPQCLNAVGSYRQSRTDNARAHQQLQADQLDESDDTNSEVQQLNLLNASQSQHMVELQAQGVVHSCIASPDDARQHATAQRCGERHQHLGVRAAATPGQQY